VPVSSWPARWRTPETAYQPFWRDKVIAPWRNLRLVQRKRIRCRRIHARNKPDPEGRPFPADSGPDSRAQLPRRRSIHAFKSSKAPSDFDALFSGHLRRFEVIFEHSRGIFEACCRYLGNGSASAVKPGRDGIVPTCANTRIGLRSDTMVNGHEVDGDFGLVSRVPNELVLGFVRVARAEHRGDLAKSCHPLPNGN
jgi:hypothetical protein